MPSQYSSSGIRDAPRLTSGSRIHTSTSCPWPPRPYYSYSLADCIAAFCPERSISTYFFYLPRESWLRSISCLILVNSSGISLHGFNIVKDSLDMEGLHRIVVGVDFGTTYSAVAWAETSRPAQIEVVTNWPTSGALVGLQAPTEISYREGDTSTFTWGYNISPRARKVGSYFK